MVCKKYKILLSAYIDRELDSKQVREVKKHIETCTSCCCELSDMQKLKNFCRQVQSPSPSPEQWGDFSDRLFAALPQQKQLRQPTWRIPTTTRVRKNFWQAVLVGTAALFVFLIRPSVHQEDFRVSLIPPLGAFGGNHFRDNIIHAPVSVIPGNKPYTLNKEIPGWTQAGFSAKESEFLLQHGFVITSRQFSSFVEVYRDNQRRNIPSFVTVDTAISGLSHILGRLQVDLEREVFVAKLMYFTATLGEQLLKLHAHVPESCRRASLRALQFTRVADRLLDESQLIEWPAHILRDIEPVVERELELIHNGRYNKGMALQKSPIFGYDINYALFKIRWNETKEAKLRRYAQAVEWYNRCVFRAVDASETRSALLLLMAVLGDSAEGIIVWDEMHQLLTTVYGEPDDPHLRDYLSIARDVYGDSISPRVLDNQRFLQRFCRKIAKIRVPRIRTEMGLKNSGLRIFGGRFYDHYLMLQQLLYPYVGDRYDPRITPTTLDIAIILGHRKAWEIAEQKGLFKLDNYKKKVQRYQNNLNQRLIMEHPWQSGGLVAQAWLYKSLMIPAGKGSPLFARSDVWEARKLTSILCGFLNLGNGKPIFTGNGNAKFCGTIDPYPEFFNRMTTTIRDVESLLRGVGYPMGRPAGQEILSYKKALQKLVTVATKVVAGKALDDKDQQQLANFALGWKGNYEEANLHELFIRMYRNADRFDDYFYAGVEPVREVWVACNENGKTFLARGGVYVLYEFMTTRKIEPAQWRKAKLWNRMKQSSAMGIAPWVKQYLAENK